MHQSHLHRDEKASPICCSQLGFVVAALDSLESEVSQVLCYLSSVLSQLHAWHCAWALQASISSPLKALPGAASPNDTTSVNLLYAGGFLVSPFPS